MKRSWRPAAVLGALAVMLVGWAGAEDAETDALPADLAHVPTKAVGLMSLRPADLYSSDAGKAVRQKMGKEASGMTDAFEKSIGVSPDKVERITAVLRDARAENPIPLLFVATTEKFDAKVVFARLVPTGKEKTVRGKTYTANESMAIAALSDQAFVFAAPDDVRLVLTSAADRKGGLAPAVRLAAGKHYGVVGVDLGGLPPLPEELPAEVEPFTPLLKARLATAVFDLGKPLSLRLHATFPDADSAAAGLKALQKAKSLGLEFLEEGIKALTQEKANEALVTLAKELRDGVKASTLNREASVVRAEVRAKIDLTVASGALLGAVMRVREAAVRAQIQNNLKQIGLAFHGYADATSKFPAQAIYSKQGKPLLSWRVAILPYLEEEKLYKEFKLDEPWDSAHNKKLLAKMPKTYATPGSKAPPGHTYFQGFAGKGAFFDGKRSTGIVDVLKGLSNTLMIVEAGTAVPWTKPEDIPFDPAKKLPKLGGGFRGGAQALLCDGSVRTLSDAISEKTLKWALLLNSGEGPPKDW